MKLLLGIPAAIVFIIVGLGIIIMGIREIRTEQYVRNSWNSLMSGDPLDRLITSRYSTYEDYVRGNRWGLILIMAMAVVLIGLGILRIVGLFIT